MTKRQAVIRKRPRASARIASATGTGGIKAATVGTTLYLLPGENKRLRHLALDLDLSVHELVLTALDRMLAKHGQPPIERYRGIREK